MPIQVLLQQSFLSVSLKLTSEKPYRGQASVLLGSFGRIDHNVEAAIGDEKKYIRLNANRSKVE